MGNMFGACFTQLEVLKTGSKCAVCWEITFQWHSNTQTMDC